MKSIRKEISDIFGFVIPEGSWEESLGALDKDGRLTNKHLWKIVTVLLKREESRELKESENQ